MNQTRQTEKNRIVIAMMRAAVAPISNKVLKHSWKTHSYNYAKKQSIVAGILNFIINI